MYVGSRLKRAWKSGRRHLKSLPSSRTGENPPYGMIGGVEETSASFEARSAPRSYPTTSAEARGGRRRYGSGSIPGELSIRNGHRSYSSCRRGNACSIVPQLATFRENVALHLKATGGFQ